MARALLLGICLIAGCGARSALEPGDGEPATGGSPGTGAGGAGGAGGQPLVGGTGGEGPLCLPVACDVNWEVTLGQPSIPGAVTDVGADPCGNTSLVGVGASAAVWAAQLDPSGDLQWSRTLTTEQGGDIDKRTSLVAGAPTGDVVIAIGFDTTFSVDGFASGSAGGFDVALMRLNSSGDVVWLKAFGAGGDDWPTALSVTSDGDILLGGVSDAGLDLGGGPVADGPFLARFSGAGEHRWSYRFAEAGGGALSFAPLSSGDFWLLGRVRRDVQFPGGALFDGGNFQDHIVVASLAADGSDRFSTVFGDPGDIASLSNADQIGFDIAEAGVGGARFVAAMRGDVDFGAGVVSAGDPPNQHGLVDVTLAADGALVSAGELLSPVDEVVAAIGPASVFLGLSGSLIEVEDETTTTLLTFGAAEWVPRVARSSDGLLVARNELSMDAETFAVFVSRFCDQP